jgi:hypothetical protein
VIALVRSDPQSQPNIGYLTYDKTSLAQFISGVVMIAQKGVVLPDAFLPRDGPVIAFGPSMVHLPYSGGVVRELPHLFPSVSLAHLLYATS